MTFPGPERALVELAEALCKTPTGSNSKAPGKRSAARGHVSPLVSVLKGPHTDPPIAVPDSGSMPGPQPSGAMIISEGLTLLR